MAEKNQRADGANYAPESTGVTKKVVKPGEFVFAAAFLDHGHIYGQTNGLLEAGAELKYVYEPNAATRAKYLEKFPQAKVVDTFEEILNNPEIRLVASAGVNNVRSDIGNRVMLAGKDYFSDKPLFTTLEQLEASKKIVAQTKRKYMGYFSERLHVECAVKAGDFIKEGRIGRVVSVTGMGPHRMSVSTRPSWFFNFEQTGGILCDIGSHQLEQFLFYSGAKSATVQASRVANYRYKEYPGYFDFGDMTLVADNGATGYFRLDWLTPDALETWGDGRMFILGTEGYIELRKYTDVGGTKQRDTLFLVNKTCNERHELHGKVGFPFFGELILDCINRTENAMTQEHVFLTSELAIRAQKNAVVVEK